MQVPYQIKACFWISQILDVNSSIYNVPYINFLDADELLKEVLVFLLVILDKVDTQ